MPFRSPLVLGYVSRVAGRASPSLRLTRNLCASLRVCTPYGRTSEEAHLTDSQRRALRAQLPLAHAEAHRNGSRTALRTTKGSSAVGAAAAQTTWPGSFLLGWGSPGTDALRRRDVREGQAARAPPHRGLRDAAQRRRRPLPPRPQADPRVHARPGVGLRRVQPAARAHAGPAVRAVHRRAHRRPPRAAADGAPPEVDVRALLRRAPARRRRVDALQGHAQRLVGRAHARVGAGGAPAALDLRRRAPPQAAR